MGSGVCPGQGLEGPGTHSSVATAAATIAAAAAAAAEAVAAAAAAGESGTGAAIPAAYATTRADLTGTTNSRVGTGSGDAHNMPFR